MTPSPRTGPSLAALPKRDTVNPARTADLTCVFKTVEEWEAAFEKAEATLPSFRGFRGTLGTSAQRLLEWVRAVESFEPQLQKLNVYAVFASAVDLASSVHLRMKERATTLDARYRETIAFAMPELLALDEGVWESLFAEEPALKEYKPYFERLKRLKPHTRSPEVEELLAGATTALAAPRNIWQVLADNEVAFAPAVASDHTAVPMVRTNYKEALMSKDRSLRESAYRSNAEAFLKVRKTLAATLTGKIHGAVFMARARNFPSALEMSLFASNVPVNVYRNVIDAFRRNIPIWHRYWEVRRKFLKLPPGKLAPWDTFAPLGEEETTVSYEQAVEWISKGMEPLGAEYVESLRAGAMEGRWVDSTQNLGKRAGAWSGGGYLTPPFILMSYADNLAGMSTLAHELGHSMHSRYSARHQPFLLYRYTLFAAEVASNFNQAMVREYLLKLDLGDAFRLALLEEAMFNFHRYLFLMPLLAQFEEFAHRTIEREGALTEKQMSEYLASLFKEAYGPAMEVHDDAEGIQWAQYNQMFSEFYVYQYASGIAGGNVLAKRVLDGTGAEAADYLAFLKAGGSKYPIDALQLAGVDMTKPETMDAGFAILERYITELEKLV